jgi:hypothetical protein
MQRNPPCAGPLRKPFRLKGEQLVNGVIGFGVLYVVILVAVLASPNLFAFFRVAANAPIHVIHAALAAVSLAVGFLRRGSTSRVAR